MAASLPGTSLPGAVGICYVRVRVRARDQAYDVGSAFKKVRQKRQKRQKGGGVTPWGDLFSRVDYFRRPSAAAAQAGHPQNSRANSPMGHASVKRFRPHNAIFTVTNAGISRSCCTSSMGTKEWELCCTTPASEKAECRASRVRSNFYYTIRLVSRLIGEPRSCIVGELAYEFDSSFRVRIIDIGIELAVDLAFHGTMGCIQRNIEEDRKSTRAIGKPWCPGTSICFVALRVHITHGLAHHESRYPLADVGISIVEGAAIVKPVQDITASVVSDISRQDYVLQLRESQGSLVHGEIPAGVDEAWRNGIIRLKRIRANQ